MSIQSLDHVIRSAYVDQPYAVDRLVQDPALRADFLRRVSNGWPSAKEDEVFRRLLTLRKRGANNGGLPRKPR